MSLQLRGCLAIPGDMPATPERVWRAIRESREPRDDQRDPPQRLRHELCRSHSARNVAHPRNRSVAYNTIGYWQDLTRLAERGKFDGIFLADIVGIYDVFRGGPAPSVSEVPSTTNPLGMRRGSEGGITPGLAAVTSRFFESNNSRTRCTIAKPKRLRAQKPRSPW